MLHDRDSTGLLWSGVCDGCLASVSPFIEGTKEEAQRVLLERGWELVTSGAGNMIRCLECSRRVREVRLDNHRGVRRRR